MIRPALPTCAGVQEPVRLLRQQLEQVSFLEWKDDVTAIHLWFLFIGGLGGYSSQHREFYLASLMAALARYNVVTLQDAKSMVQQFVWSDRTCDQGAAVLWDAVQRKSIRRAY